jgi:hypothetical protein
MRLLWIDTFLPIFLAAAIGCSERAQRPASDSASLPPQARVAAESVAPTGRVSSEVPADATPDSVLRVFLDWSLAGRRPNSVNRSSVYSCRDEEDIGSGLWMADARIDSVLLRGDTAVAHVVLTAVARQNFDGRMHHVTLKIEELPARFVLIREDGRWKVCGTESSVSVLSGGQTMVWSPEGASRSRAIALIDSIRTARGLPLKH